MPSGRANKRSNRGRWTACPSASVRTGAVRPAGHRRAIDVADAPLRVVAMAEVAARAEAAEAAIPAVELAGVRR